MVSHGKHVTADKDHVRVDQLFAYGMGGLIPIALFNSAGQLMGLLGNISLGLSAFWLGFIMIVPRLWDAVSDPLMGHLSDNTRTRWGRRRPYILFGGIAVAISFVLMWWVPRGEAVQAYFDTEAAYSWFQLGFILFGLLLFFTSCTVFEIPHGALGMEMSPDYHERTRLFSAKSFMGNVFAMATPWFFALAGLEFFRGPGGDLIDGMRFVSLFIAALVVPLSVWWFYSLEEPGFQVAKAQKKTPFLQNMKQALSNRTFLGLVVIVFTLAMAFDIVSLFEMYITIFYLYGGDSKGAGLLLGISGTVWGITSMLAVFPLNWLSSRIGKNKTLLIAIFLMSVAQLSRIFCYSPEYPYLILIPKILLSSGMLMFFTLGASMVGDICDEDELKTNTRSEGSYYSVYWWIIKTGRAFASFATGALLVLVSFDETQNVAVEKLQSAIGAIRADTEQWETEGTNLETRTESFEENASQALAALGELQERLESRLNEDPPIAKHSRKLKDHLDSFVFTFDRFQATSSPEVASSSTIRDQADLLVEDSVLLKEQAPKTLFLLRLVEIGLPVALSLVSVFFTLRYPLTENRCYEIKAALDKRRKSAAELSEENPIS